MERFKKQLDFLIEIDKLKQVFRNTILMDASRLENDAEHMWHMAVGAMLFSEYSNNKDIDMLKVLKMVLIHDVIEIYAGDTFAYDEQGHVDKEEREQNAANKIFALLPREQELEFRSLWDEFEASITAEAKYAKAMDRFMPILHNYITKGAQWHKFGITSDKVLAKNSIIEQGSEFLWEYVKHMVEDSIEKGYLAD
ncbi:MAG TPA: HD domain-containing protein [Clostridiales bacterium]|nr:HD domain-containing protein [Clostridiales bacterium]